MVGYTPIVKPWLMGASLSARLLVFSAILANLTGWAPVAPRFLAQAFPPASSPSCAGSRQSFPTKASAGATDSRRPCGRVRGSWCDPLSPTRTSRAQSRRTSPCHFENCTMSLPILGRARICQKRTPKNVTNCARCGIVGTAGISIRSGTMTHLFPVEALARTVAGKRADFFVARAGSIARLPSNILSRGRWRGPANRPDGRRRDRGTRML